MTDEDDLDDLIEDGKTALMEGRLSDARSFFEEVIEEDPNNGLAMFYKAETIRLRDARSLKKSQKALQLIQEAVELDPECRLAWLGGGELLVNMGLRVEALQWYDRMHRALPDDVSSLRKIADVLAHQGHTVEAGRVLGAYLDKVPGDPSAARLAFMLGRRRPFSVNQMAESDWATLHARKDRRKLPLGALMLFAAVLGVASAWILMNQFLSAFVGTGFWFWCLTAVGGITLFIWFAQSLGRIWMMWELPTASIRKLVEFELEQGALFIPDELRDSRIYERATTGLGALQVARLGKIIEAGDRFERENEETYDMAPLLNRLGGNDEEE